MVAGRLIAIAAFAAGVAVGAPSGCAVGLAGFAKEQLDVSKNIATVAAGAQESATRFLDESAAQRRYHADQIAALEREVRARAERAEAAAKSLRWQLAQERNKAVEVQNEIVSSDVGTCRFSDDAVRLYGEIGERANAGTDLPEARSPAAAGAAGRPSTIPDGSRGSGVHESRRSG